MRLCRYEHQGATQIGFYLDDAIIPLAKAGKAAGVEVPSDGSLLPLLTNGATRSSVRKLEESLGKLPDRELASLKIGAGEVALLVPIPAPTKILLLAGNYSKHIEEGGGRAEERARTFPYVF